MHYYLIYNISYQQTLNIVFDVSLCSSRRPKCSLCNECSGRALREEEVVDRARHFLREAVQSREGVMVVVSFK